MSINKSILAIAAVLSTAAAAQAAPEPGVPQMTVRYGDLDLSSRSGATAMYQRMQAASRVACESYGEGNTIADRAFNKSCRDDLISQGVDRLHSPELAAVAADGAAPIQVASH